MLVTEAIQLILMIGKGVQNAIQAGRQDVSEEDVDAAFDRIAASDQRLSDAIARARAREAGESPDPE